jgi:hypothetical protein
MLYSLLLIMINQDNMVHHNDHEMLRACHTYLLEIVYNRLRLSADLVYILLRLAPVSPPLLSHVYSRALPTVSVPSTTRSLT